MAGQVDAHQDIFGDRPFGIGERDGFDKIPNLAIIENLPYRLRFLQRGESDLVTGIVRHHAFSFYRFEKRETRFFVQSGHHDFIRFEGIITYSEHSKLRAVFVNDTLALVKIVTMPEQVFARFGRRNLEAFGILTGTVLSDNDVAVRVRRRLAFDVRTLDVGINTSILNIHLLAQLVVKAVLVSGQFYNGLAVMFHARPPFHL